jgi:hypothetical protein
MAFSASSLLTSNFFAAVIEQFRFGVDAPQKGALPDPQPGGV